MNRKNVAIWLPKAAKLFSWALVRQVATCRFHSCVYTRSSLDFTVDTIQVTKRK